MQSLLNRLLHGNCWNWLPVAFQSCANALFIGQIQPAAELGHASQTGDHIWCCWLAFTCMTSGITRSRASLHLVSQMCSANCQIASLCSRENSFCITCRQVIGMLQGSSHPNAVRIMQIMTGWASSKDIIL